ncbi:ECF transporter S component [Aeromicrobium sp.]|uniref:ECF transporter S component n=1 Tax=Aeromicrobium sp. TaxID=1871063 RepID=UPI0030C483B5
MSSATTSTSNKRFGGRYRTIDLVTMTTLAVAFGVIFWGWGKLYAPLSGLAVFSFPPSAALIAGPWLAAGIVGGLIIRKPGAAFGTEFLAAAVSSVVLGGTEWGWTVFASGFFQGLGAELIFLLFFYKKFGIVVAMLAGAGAAIVEAFYEWTQPFTAEWDLGYKLAHLGFLTTAGVVVAGAGGWLLVRALAETGVLDAFGAGRDAAGER